MDTALGRQRKTEEAPIARPARNGEFFVAVFAGANRVAKPTGGEAEPVQAIHRPLVITVFTRDRECLLRWCNRLHQSTADIVVLSERIQRLAAQHRSWIATLAGQCFVVHALPEREEAVREPV